MDERRIRACPASSIHFPLPPCSQGGMATQGKVMGEWVGRVDLHIRCVILIGVTTQSTVERRYQINARVEYICMNFAYRSGQLWKLKFNECLGLCARKGRMDGRKVDGGCEEGTGMGDPPAW